MILPQELYRVSQIREVEQLALQASSEELLMSRAGSAAFDVLRRHFPEALHITVLCGSGNNGGDGLKLARQAHNEGLEVIVLTLGDFANQSDAAKSMLRDAIAVGIEVREFTEADLLDETDLIVDAMLGIGVTGAVRGLYRTAIDTINEGEVPVLALDIPSGLDADSGAAQGVAVVADITVTIIGLKQGMVTGQGKYYCGDIQLANLDLDELIESQEISGMAVGPAILSNLLPVPAEHVHKGMMGHVLVIGGDDGMPGAVCLAAQAALRVGAGKVTIVSRERHFNIIMCARSEFICVAVEEDMSRLTELFETVDVCVIGPGMYGSDWSRQILKTALTFSGPKVLDAGALVLLNEFDISLQNTVITPHPGEAGCLLRCSPVEIEQHRYAAALQLAEQKADVAVLKGAGTIIQMRTGHTYVCAAGNPGMATAGMGDVLAGMIGGLIAQSESLEDAALAGVLLHAHCADIATNEIGSAALLAGDMFNYVGQAMGNIEIEWSIEEAD